VTDEKKIRICIIIIAVLSVLLICSGVAIGQGQISIRRFKGNVDAAQEQSYRIAEELRISIDRNTELRRENNLITKYSSEARDHNLRAAELIRAGLLGDTDTLGLIESIIDGLEELEHAENAASNFIQ